MPLDQVSFELDEGDDVGVTFDPRLGDDGTRWRFALLDALPRHLVAVAVEAGAAPCCSESSRTSRCAGSCSTAAWRLVVKRQEVDQAPALTRFARAAR